MSHERRQHWDHLHSVNRDRDVSWFESVPTVSLRLMEAAGLAAETCVLDVGGGDSRLVDQLLARGLRCLAVLDVSETALRRSKTRLGRSAHVPIWLLADVTSDWSLKPMDIWHDRAVFHFLTDPDDRKRYRQHLGETLKPGGSAIIATFALDGPETCSGLPVARYSPEQLAAELGEGFRLMESVPHVHRTPGGATQAFQYSWLSRVA